jgi:hypothetical protein
LLHGGEFLSVFDKAKKETEDAAKKTSEGAKSAGHKVEDESKKVAKKVSG